MEKFIDYVPPKLNKWAEKRKARRARKRGTGEDAVAPPMPCTSEQQGHRTKYGTQWHVPACVAKPVSRKLLKENSERADKAKDSMAK